MGIRSVLKPETVAKIFDNNWPIRRRWLRIGMFALWANAELVLVWQLIYGSDPLLVQVFYGLLGAIMSIFMMYVFGAVWDDSNKMRHFGGSFGGRHNHTDTSELPDAPPRETEDE
jgi:hypothetical protein